MDTSSDGAVESDISNIEYIRGAVRRQSIDRWNKGQDLSETARETNLTIKQVNGIWKLRQKSAIEKRVKKR